jgi:hypothetical protein
MRVASASMGAALRLLTILALVFCALGIGETDAAHASAPSAQASATAVPDTPPADPGGAIPEAAHHHHCPLAPALPQARTAAHPASAASAPVASRIAALASLTRAPPLEPPAA